MKLSVLLAPLALISALVSGCGAPSGDNKNDPNKGAAKDDKTGAAKDTKKDEKPVVKKKDDKTKVAAKPVKKPGDDLDLDAGNKKIASLWNEMDAAKLLPIIEPWKDDDLAKVMLKMDPSKVSEVLGTMKPDRASRLSKALQKLASIKPPETT